VRVYSCVRVRVKNCTKKTPFSSALLGFEAGVIGKERWEHYQSTSGALESCMQALQDIKMPAKRWADYNISPSTRVSNDNVNDNGSLRR
jgi:tRNA uridine 5-carboxymethylaminomethyl modification enzyme